METRVARGAADGGVERCTRAHHLGPRRSIAKPLKLVYYSPRRSVCAHAPLRLRSQARHRQTPFSSMDQMQRHADRGHGGDAPASAHAQQAGPDKSRQQQQPPSSLNPTAASLLREAIVSSRTARSRWPRRAPRTSWPSRAPSTGWTRLSSSP